LKHAARGAAAAFGLLAAACGSDDAVTPTPVLAPMSGVPRVTAAGLPSPYNMVLRSRLDGTALAQAAGGPGGSVAGSGNWGYTSPDGRRFALTGTSGGLSVVEVTDPARPVNVALVAGMRSPWREVKTYGSYAYVTTEAQTGLDVVDMRRPDRPVKVRTWNETFQSAHTLWIDQERALLFANGTRNGLRVLDLEPDPSNPREVGSFTSYYVHDSYARGNLLFASAIQNGRLALLDVANPAAITEITSFTTGGQFTHNAWLSRDGRHLFTTDEVPDRPVEGWDLSDPMRPRKVVEYLGAPGTIAHNVSIDGDRLLISHYTEGVHLLDVSDPERPRVLGTYDTYAGSAPGNFHGAWGAYIFPGSNLILVSDIEGGLFVVEYTGSS
jgi:choice-of-anchor B domain-containing protein